MATLRKLLKLVPTLLLSLALAVAVWISAVTAADPTEERVYPRKVTIELIGQDPGLVLTGDVQSELTLNLSAPKSIWERLTNDRVPVRAVVDLAGLTSGTHTRPIQIQVGISPVEVVSYSPQTITVNLETLASRTFTIKYKPKGEPAVGYLADTPTFSQTTVTVAGPESLVNRVNEVRASLDLTQVRDSINRSVTLQALDANEQVVKDVTLSPERVQVNQSITQRGGYRNVVVKVVVIGQIANGYRLTNISAFPPAVTVFSSNPQLVNNLPGYVETVPLNLNGARDDIDTNVNLNLPSGVSVVGDQSVQVQVGIAAIEGSRTLANMKVEITGLAANLSARISPETVDVILSGPLPVLDALAMSDVRVIIDLTGMEGGTFQIAPRVELKTADLRVESILPSTIEVVISAGTPTAPPQKP